MSGSVLMQGRHRQTGGAEGLTVPVACLALSLLLICHGVRLHCGSSQRVRGGLDGDRDPCASSSSSPECQEVAAFVGVQAEFFWGSCHVLGLALAIGVVRNTTDCGVAQGTPGRAWSKKGCQGGMLGTRPS